MESRPTHYMGVNFRSRLEARWAAMFDLMSWKWEYEPIEPDGYIPDFLVHGQRKIFVEVKPFETVEEFPIKKIETILKDSPDADILLLGRAPFIHDSEPQVGWISESNEYGKVNFYDTAIFNHFSDEWGFRSQYMGWQDRITGKYDGDAYVCVPGEWEIEQLWREAGNRTQYKSPS